MSSLLPNLLHFGRLLRSIGLDVQAGRMLDVASALEHVDIGRRTDFYFTLRSLLVHRQQDLVLFDEAFRVFWRRPPGERSSVDLRALGERRRLGPPQRDAPAVEPRPQDDRSPATLGDETVDGIAPMSYSSREVSRVKDFARFTEEELKQAKAMIAAFRWDLGRRQTRRWAPGRGRIPDLRRVVRSNLRYGGEPLTLPTRARIRRIDADKSVTAKKFGYSQSTCDI